MKRFLFLVLIFQNGFSQEIPLNVQKLIKAYPNQIVGYKDNKVIFSDKSNLIYDDFKNKTNQELLENPDIEDQFKFVYNKTNMNLIPKEDPGRIRNEAFFKKIYGNSKSEVESKMTEIIWCPKLVNQKIKVTSVNGIDKIVKKLSAELDNHPEFKKYINAIGGTFSWRKISGTNRLSMHSYGMTIDINVQNSNYWQWDCKCKNEEATLSYRNQIPLKLVSIFEKYGFIWGGNWKHYDTMHFEYRPELFL
ncbi:M15 family metallopeptidase [Flavobacterium sp. F-65]|uniref:M15 family metallopeptidase n=1 Tax=Flavobacterium pisciphilum TaxID=2893755 RepID=A0ABS8MMR7_9FLAO|nr:M15 family metallopeptidase [Flavobacterium sp. F-65]MCC9070058.1 M15 family metallopeptidase [Flavobacterium sp. F-65]